MLFQDEKLLVWYSADKEKNLELSTVSNVLLGQKTVRRPYIIILLPKSGTSMY